MALVTNPFVFQTDSEEVNKVYAENANYLIEESDVSGLIEPYCALYFSSNDIYYPNTNVAFQKQLLAKNKFEWYGTRIPYANKHIFLRDIKKQWYLTGINIELNSVEKVYQFLKEQTKGYKIITIGSSAGGFAAVLFGQLLKASITYTFNGQFMLSDLLINSSEQKNPIVFRERENPNINQYYSLKKIICNPNNIFYFYSKYSKWDILQFEHIKDLGLNVVPFKTGHHGVPFLKSNFPYLLRYSFNELIELNAKTQHPLTFSFKMEGVFSTLYNLGVNFVKFRLKKLKRKQLQNIKQNS